ncbi:MAG: hypothetical protein QXS76_00125 [Candidatus Bathyarchaeia archaeon]
MRSVEIIVDEEGRLHIKWGGFKGDACFQEAERLYALLKSLGMEVRKERVERTPESYTTDAAVVRNGY